MNFLTKTIANRTLSSSSYPKKCQLFQSFSRFVSKTTTPRKSKIPKPQEPSSSYSLTPPKIETNEAENISSWPKPSEIPYQSKVANFVNLVGFVQTPIQFETSPDGNYCAGTVLAHENNDNNNNSILMIPVVFVGDLAHVVACHVKENDSVYVSGKFSMDPMPCEIMDKYKFSFHIVAENVNFVQGLKQIAPRKARGQFVYPKSSTKQQHSDNEKDISLSTLENDDSVVNSGGGSKSEGGDEWRDLIKNPKQWWDCRKAKLDGIVKARHPDFKKKDSSSIALWLENAPRWVLEGVEGLEFDVYVPKSKGVGKEVDSWKDLLENPDKWWDNRATKLNQKAPDFKHKNTGIGLWVDNSPDWVLSQLPPLRDQRAEYKMNQS